jgi:pre-mRNA-splicing factor SYF1
MFNIYIKRCGEMQGITATREIYEKAIESLEEERAVRDMCLRYADLERKLGEIDRARSIYSHCSQMCDPRVRRRIFFNSNEFIFCILDT